MRSTVAILLLTVVACGSGEEKLDRAERDLDADRFVEARKALIDSYGNTPGPARAALLLARAQRECGNANAARVALGGLRGHDADAPAAKVEKARVLLAIAAMERELGRKRRAAGALTQARGLLRSLAGKTRRSPDVLLLAADIEIHLGRGGAARNWIEEARVVGASEADADTKEALLLEKSGARDEAVARLEAVLAGEREHAGALYILGTLELAGGKVAKGRRHLEQAVRVDPAHPYASMRLARLFLDTGRTKEAIEVAGPHVKRRPDDLSGLLTYSRALAVGMRWAAAAETMRHAVSLHPKEPSVLNNLGVILFEGAVFKNEWLAEAIATHERAVACAPDDVMNGYNLARCLVKQHTDETMARAAKIYDDLLDRTRGIPAFTALRMRMHRNAGLIKSDTFKRWKEAYEHYKAFFEMGGDREDKGILDEWGKVLDGLGEPYRAPPEKKR